MARSTKSLEPQPANLSVDQMRQGIERFQRRIADLEAFDPGSVQKRFAPEVAALSKSIEETLGRVFGDGSIEFRRYHTATRLDRGPVYVTRNGPDLRTVQQYLRDGKQASLTLLQQIVRGLEEEIELKSREAPAPKDFTAFAAFPVEVAPLAPPLRKAFVVHGHDEGARESVARFLERIGFEPIILHEQANQGRTIIEKIEAHGDVGLAVVLLTPDDVGGINVEQVRPRARQNVILELGYFIAKLGRHRVVALKRGELEIPTDFGGVVYQEYDANGGWKQGLAREAEAAGFEIDWNRVMRA